MITLITAWVTERIVTVVTVTLVAVAAVPTTLVLTTEHHADVVLQQQGEEHKIVLIKAVKKAGDDLVVKLQNAESSCNTQVTQLVAASKVNPAVIQSQLAQAKTQLHGSVAPFVAAVQKHEDHIAHLDQVSDQDEEDELSQIQLIEITALGSGQTTGVVTVTCQTVVVEIKLVIQVNVTVIVHKSGGDGD